MRLLSLLLLLFCACAPVIPPLQKQLCEMIIPALDLEASEIAISHNEKKGDALRVNYRVKVKGEVKPRFVICHFKVEGNAYPEIIKLETQNGVVKEWQLLFIKRFYIPEQLSDKQRSLNLLEAGAFITATHLIALSR